MDVENGWLNCKTADLIVIITSNVLSFAVVLGAMFQVFMVYKMAVNHRANLLSLRRGQ